MPLASIRALAPVTLCVVFCALSAPVIAQGTAPAPPAVPVGEVGAAPLAPSAGQTIEGTATAIDGDELRVGDTRVRLFGIAAPDISANLGPDARVGLEALAGGQRVVCTEVDRTAEGSVAICSVGETDLAAALLTGGLASVYRVAAAPTAAEQDLAARYDSAEADARAGKRGIWAPRDAVPPPPPPPPQPTLVQSALPKWIEQAPLLGLIAVLGIIALVLLARRRAVPATDEDAADSQALTAAFLAEVAAIRDSAQEQYDGTASLIQDLPIPSSHQGLLGLPRATVYGANADRVDLLPSGLAVRLIRFYAMHDGVAQLLQHTETVRCETLRAALHGLARSADEALQAR
jgi:endonuclease YncB( thermonuclease family)